MNFNTTQFELQYVRVTITPANLSAIMGSLNMCKNGIAFKTYHQKITGTLKHEEIKKQKRIKRALIFGTLEHEEIKKKKRNLYHHQKRRKNSSERISKFVELINEGPYYICVVCNRCHYFRSVVSFKSEIYDIDTDNFYREVPSFDRNLYICHIYVP